MEQRSSGCSARFGVASFLWLPLLGTKIVSSSSANFGRAGDGPKNIPLDLRCLRSNRPLELTY